MHPLTGKHIHAIAAVDNEGNQRGFGKGEKRRADRLGLDPRSVLTHRPAVTTIYNLARMYYEAARQIPMLTVNLEGLFEYERGERHFWSTDAGKAQCLAYVLQAAFTLELCLKSILEVVGRLSEDPDGGRPDWQTHRPTELLALLNDDERQRVERRWMSLPVGERHSHGSYQEFLESIDDLYMGLRYLQRDLRSVNPQVEMLGLLSAARVALDVAETLLRERSPFKINVTTRVHSDPERPATRPGLVEGVVRSVSIPGGFDPHSQVQVEIESRDGSGNVTALFRKADAENYYGIDGFEVCVAGYTSDEEPSVLRGSHHVGCGGRPPAEPSYSHERRVLSGIVYDLAAYETAPSQRAVRLILDDATYFSRVECLFTTDEEREQLADVHLGDQIRVRGIVSLRNGKPMVLLGPEIVDADAE